MNKKGVELSVNVIIIAIIAILVLTVLFAIFTGKMASFMNMLAGKKCTEIGGQPKSLEEGCPTGMVKTWAKTGTAPGELVQGQEICCVQSH